MDRALGYRVNHRLYLQLFRRFVPIKQRLMTVVSLTFILLSHINYFVKGKAHNITYLIASHYYWSLLGNVSKMMDNSTGSEPGRLEAKNPNQSQGNRPKSLRTLVFSSVRKWCIYNDESCGSNCPLNLFWCHCPFNLFLVTPPLICVDECPFQGDRLTRNWL